MTVDGSESTSKQSDSETITVESSSKQSESLQSSLVEVEGTPVESESVQREKYDDRYYTKLGNINEIKQLKEKSGCAVCQKVDILPHERYDKALSLIEKFSTMMKCIDHAGCPVSSDDLFNLPFMGL